MRRLMLIMAVSVTLSMAGCNESGSGTVSAGPTPTTEREPVLGAGGVGTTTAPAPASTAAPVSSRPGPRMQVSLYAQAGEVPPGRVAQLEAPAWKATGSGWDRGDVDLFIRRAGGEGAVLDVGASADSSGRWEQTFVLPSDAPAGSYLAVASQGSLHAEGSFVLKSSGAVQDAEEVVASGSTASGQWQLVAQRQSGLVCVVLRMGGYVRPVCGAPTEEDFNGDDTLRYGRRGEADSGSFILGVAGPRVAKVRAELLGGGVVEVQTVPASFTTARFVALPLPQQAVLSTLVALDAGGQQLTRFALNPWGAAPLK